MINIGVIGYGYWGPNLVRNFVGLEGARVRTVADLLKDKLQKIKKIYPTINLTTSINDIFSDKTVDAVVIATPISTHYKLAKEALNCGKHVLVEKPLAFSSRQVKELIKLAKQKDKILMVDHTFIYCAAVQKIKQLVDGHKLGKINYLDSTRINLGLVQKDANVLWDLAAHDLSILCYLTGNKRPQTVQAIGTSHFKNGIENIAYLILKYKNGFIAHFNCSWSAPVKIRLMLVGGNKKMVVWNDLEPTEKVKIYDKGFLVRTDEEKHKILFGYREGDIFIPKIEVLEALHNMAQDFVGAIKSKNAPLADGEQGLLVVRILELAQKSIKNHGKEIKWHE